MTPTQGEIIAFRMGYAHVVSILEGVRDRRSHLNHNTARILNEALTEIITVLRQDLPHALPTQTPK